MLLETLKFLTPESARRVRDLCGTPAFVYDEALLAANARAALAFPAPFGLTVRFAMKACPNGAILRLFGGLGLHIDASSVYEAARAVLAGIAPEKISLATQELPGDFANWIRRGVRLNACSLHQLGSYGAAFPGGEVGLRINPGLGSGSTGKTNVGGPSSSFGIWHELLDEADAIIRRHDLRVVRIHTHIGSGADPVVWQRVAGMSLAFVERYEDVVTLNLGGGFKVARMSDERGTDLQAAGEPVRVALEDFATRTGRRIALEIEPGTYLVANAGALLATVQDITSTGSEGHEFLKLDTGMTEICRPSLYGARHPIVIVPADETSRNETRSVVVGHCCESGDLLTPVAGRPEELESRRLLQAKIGDLAVIEGTGAYCAAMSTKNYNSFPEAPEVLIEDGGELRMIRRRQTLEQMIANEGRPEEAAALEE